MVGPNNIFKIKFVFDILFYHWPDHSLIKVDIFSKILASSRRKCRLVIRHVCLNGWMDVVLSAIIFFICFNIILYMNIQPPVKVGPPKFLLFCSIKRLFTIHKFLIKYWLGFYSMSGSLDSFFCGIFSLHFMINILLIF